MIAYIKGTLMSVDDGSITIDVHGIGYEIHVATSTHYSLPAVGEELLIHTYYQQKEDSVHLYGFMTKDELELYKKLITVSGIGPKGGLAILATLTPHELRYAIATEDIKTISTAPGVGKKTAQRLVLELKEKIQTDPRLLMESPVGVNVSLGPIGEKDDEEALTALMALGYSKMEAEKAIREAGYQETVEDIIKEALKKLASI